MGKKWVGVFFLTKSQKTKASDASLSHKNTSKCIQGFILAFYNGIYCDMLLHCIHALNEEALAYIRNLCIFLLYIFLQLSFHFHSKSSQS